MAIVQETVAEYKKLLLAGPRPRLPLLGPLPLPMILRKSRAYRSEAPEKNYVFLKWYIRLRQFPNPLSPMSPFGIPCETSSEVN